MNAKIVKGFKNIFIKLLARKKSLCIFALGFGIRVSPNKIKIHKQDF
jgi:hypothetical protein